MDWSPKPPKTPTSDSDGNTLLCTPQPASKRPTAHIATPDLDRHAKKFKMGDQSKEGANDSGQDNISLTQRSRRENPEFGQTLDSQSPEKAEMSLLPPHHDLNALVIKYEEELADLRAQMDDLKVKMQDLEAKVPIKDQQLENLKQYIAVQYLHPLQVTTQGPDDSAVTSKFSVLRYAITNLAQIELNGHPFCKPTKIDHKNLFKRLTQTEEDYKDYLGDSSGLKAFFFEGVIWTKLIDRLIGSPLSAFLDVNEGVIRDHVYNRGGASPQKFHAWRAYTADFLENALGPRTPWRPQGKLRSQLIEELVEVLSRYSTSGGGNVAALTQQVDNVVDKAVNLAWLMAKSRAYWVCKLPVCSETNMPHGFIYNKGYMKVEQYLAGGRRDIVDLIGRPSMLKYGDSNGEEYETYVVVVKAVALVYEGKKPKTADPSFLDS